MRIKDESMKQWMIYGANGYTGRLIAEVAKNRGFSPVLAGRNSTKIATVAAAFQLPVAGF